MTQSSDLKRNIIYNSVNHWYWYVGGLVLLEILNMSVLSLYTPVWLPAVITVLLLAMGCGYVGAVYQYIKKEHDMYLESMVSGLGRQISDQIEKINIEICEIEEKRTHENKSRFIALFDSMEKIHSDLIEMIQDHSNRLGKDISANQETLQNGQESIRDRLLESMDKKCDEISKDIGRLSVRVDRVAKDGYTKFDSHYTDIKQTVKDIGHETQEIVENKIKDTAVDQNNHYIAIESKVADVWNEAQDRFTGLTSLIRDIDTHNIENINEKFRHLDDSIADKNKYIEDLIGGISCDIVNQFNDISNLVKEQSAAVESNIISETTKEAKENYRNLANHVDGHMTKTIDTVVNKSIELANSIEKNESRMVESLASGESRLVNAIDDINNKQSDINKLVANLISDEEQRMTEILKEVSNLQDHISALHNKAVQSVNLSISESEDRQNFKAEDRNRAIAGEVDRLNQRIGSLTEIIGDRADRLDSTVSKISSYSKKSEEIDSRIKENFAGMLGSVSDLNDKIAYMTEALSISEEETISKLANLEAQLTVLNGLSGLLKAGQMSGQSPSDGLKDVEKGMDRTEKIEDTQNGIVVVNTYKDNILRNSDMYESDRKIYSAGYDEEGIMTSSKNFNKAGEVLTEMTYYPNGAVKERKERIKSNGRFTMRITRFGEDGRKLS